MTAKIIQQIDDVISQYREARKISKFDACSDLPDEEKTVLLNLISSTVRQFSPPGSQYEKNRLRTQSGTLSRTLYVNHLLADAQTSGIAGNPYFTRCPALCP